MRRPPFLLPTPTPLAGKVEKPDTTGHERELGNELKRDHVLNVTGNHAHNYYTTKPKTLKPSPNGAQYGDQPKYSPPHDP